MTALLLLLCASALLESSGAWPPNGTCLYQCETDSDCASCGDGATGVCKGALPTTRICVDAASNPPREPPAATAAASWPHVWAADLYSLTYANNSSKTKVDTGRFYYDYPNLRQVQDYGNVKLLYISATSNTTHSKFYFDAFGVGCFYVDTTDPLTHIDIPIPAPDFMARCAAAGDAAYVGREKIGGEWVDHYNCSVFYNGETDSFQTWHSLGLLDAAFGTPLALAAGDSTPNWQKPRLNSQWFANVTVGPGTVPGSLFKLPPICIPIPGETLRSQLHVDVPAGRSIFSAFSRKDVRDRACELLIKMSKTTAQ